ncbi:3-oxoacyl-[acyl-carrier protein] reductase [Sinobacterium caligoides]|uniref:3-oxoacyl-[acyl-carrier protein] reductase n=1 Tax=Sinobacterium caligoides TaxID=933926 RepID=A0A3N2DPZ6_9GAMM|nr:SDR family NAD(P)-dependent oxidoreductase [Sinobacterium caligoides]ROS01850.1 3-oxoacyl-[acyl-carrier protein] reductase [Sinobacterium caligoides]
MKKVLITGGGGDIAKAIISQLEQDEAEYEIFSPTRLELNVLDHNNVNKYVNDIKPDILINNAGYIEVNNIVGGDFNKDQQSIAINLTAVFNLSITAATFNPKIKIINIGSSAGTKPRGGWSAYCASKAAVIMATECWADEGIDTVCISPGRTVSKMRAKLFPAEDQATLLKSEDFAKVVTLAIAEKYKRGSNIDVNIGNIEELLSE